MFKKSKFFLQGVEESFFKNLKIKMMKYKETWVESLKFFLAEDIKTTGRDPFRKLKFPKKRRTVPEVTLFFQITKSKL